MKETHEYDDIINIEHHTSAIRPKMAQADRAAQFSPFAALTGFEAAIKETARLTDDKIELDENKKADLNEKLRYVSENADENMMVHLTYFVKDRRKDGGKYVTKTGVVKRIDEYKRILVFEDNSSVCIDDIYEIEGDSFEFNALL